MKSNENLLVVEFSDRIFSDALIKLNKKKKIIHTWISSTHLKNKEFNFIHNQDCVNGTNFIIDKNLKLKTNPLKPLQYLLAKNMLKRQMPLSNMSEKNKKKFINYLIFNWYNFLKLNKIKKTVFFNTPHLTYSYIIYCLCKKLKIETKILEKTKYLDYYYVTDNINKIEATSKFNFNLSCPTHIENYLNQFNEGLNIRTHNELQSDTNIEIIRIIYRAFIRPFFKSKNLRNFFFKKNKTRFHNYSDFLPFDIRSFHTNFYDNFFYFKSFFICKKLTNKYDKKSIHFSEIDLKFNYILFAANFQPEKSTSPDANYYYDQYKILKILDNFCKKNKKFKILYKEHPSQFLIKRFGFMEKNQIYYDKIFKLKNLIFLKINTKTKDVINISTITATATSEMALQSVLLGKPSVIFGNIWFSKCRNIYKYKKNFQKLIKKILKTKFNNNIKKYLIGLQNSKNLDLNKKNNQKNVVSYVNKYIF